MGDEREKLTPRLELPRLFGRRKPSAGDEPTAVLDAGDVARAEPEPVAPPTPVSVPATAPAETGSPLFVDEGTPAPPTKRVKKVKRARRKRQPLRFFRGLLAAGITGLVVGLAIVGLTALALRGCEAARDTSTCGSPAGFLLLVAILVAMIYVGGLLLRLARVPDPGSTSFLAVGLVAVIALLFLLDFILNWWIVLVIPPITVLTYLGAHWMTTAFVEPSETTRRPEPEDSPAGR